MPEQNAPTQQEVDSMIPEWDNLFVEIENRLGTDITAKSPELIQAEMGLSEITNTMMALRHTFHLNVPQFYMDKATELMNQLRQVGMGKDERAWNSYLMSKIKLLKEMVADTRELNKDIVRDVASSLVKKIMNTFEKHKAIFSTENFDLKDEAERAISAVENKFGIQLKDNNSFDVESITSDKVLDLYDEIQKMKPGKEKENKKRLFQQWQKQLVSALRLRKIISRRDDQKGMSWMKNRRDWGNLNPTERIHENKPKKGEEEKEAIQEGMNEYEEKH